MKLLKKKILFTLTFKTNIFRFQDNFTYYNYNFLYQHLSFFRPSSIRVACAELRQEGSIDKIIRNETPYFRLTSKGKERLLSCFPFYHQPKTKWDKIWRLAIIKSEFHHDNSDIRILRTVLCNAGFRKFSRGIYLSPWPISEKVRVLLLERSFSAKIALIEAKKFLFMDNEQLTKDIWHLASLLKDYEILIRQIKTLLKEKNVPISLTPKEKRLFSLISDKFFSLLINDPGLPKQLLPTDWPAKTARDCFLRLTRLVCID